MSDQYPPNPTRLCGTKHPGFYLESSLSVTGSLAAITWILGTHIEGGINCLTQITPRAMQLGNLPATLTMGEFISADVPFSQALETAQGPEAEATRLAYDALTKAAAPIALFDHVGSNNYTPHEFAKELGELGPSRRVPKVMALQMAEAVNRFGALPIVFTHSDMPLFTDMAQRDRVIDLAAAAYGFDPAEVYTVPTWHRPQWGMYAKSEDRGHDHYMVAILAAAARIKRTPALLTGETAKTWRPLAEALAKVPTIETPFCASWITKVTYVTNNDGDPAVSDEMARKGLDVLNLDELGD